MKKSKRFLCMLIAAVMLLGAFPAHAASAPPAATYKAASPTRLPDGTTGAKVGAAGVDKLDSHSANESGVYGAITAANIGHNEWLVNPGSIGAPRAKKNPTIYLGFDPSWTRLADFAGQKIPAGLLVDVYYNRSAGENANKFICQYDTRGMTEDFVVPCAPGQDPSKPQPKKAPAQPRTSFADVQPGSKYYDAVTTLAKNRVLLGVFDEDPNGNLKVNAPVSRSELEQLRKRLGGTSTEEYAWTREPCSQTPDCIWSSSTSMTDVHYNPNAYDHTLCTHASMSDYNAIKVNGYANLSRCAWKDRCGPGITRYQLMDWVGDIMTNYGYTDVQYATITPEQAQVNAARLAADSKWIDSYADWQAKHATGGPVTNSVSDRYAYYKKNLLRTWNAAYTEGATEAELADGSYLLQPMTRGDVCLLLYRLGITQFGQAARK